MNGKSDLVDIEAEIRKDEDDYWMVYAGDHKPDGREKWVSLSKEHAVHDPDAGTFAMPEWYAIRKGLV